MSKIHYITAIDAPNGIFKSQVVDVLNYLEKEFNAQFQLVSFIPVKDYFKHKRKIKAYRSEARVFPMVFGVSRWSKHRFFLRFISNKVKSICRGPIAFALAENLFRQVVYDGRAAVKAEIEEYNYTGNKALGQTFVKAEKNAVLSSSYNISVSNQLVNWWKSELGYKESNYTVIPCAVGKIGKLGEKKEDEVVRIVYSGGTSSWQSFDLVVDLLDEALQNQRNLEVTFMTREQPRVDELIRKFPSKVKRIWVSPEDVKSVLSDCDYGILIRDSRITNKVASPVKFAEYLEAGLSVLISQNIGDYTSFVLNNDCGTIIENKIPQLNKVLDSERNRNHRLAKENLSKYSESVKSGYEDLMNHLNNGKG